MSLSLIPDSESEADSKSTIFESAFDFESTDSQLTQKSVVLSLNNKLFLLSIKKTNQQLSNLLKNNYLF